MRASTVSTADLVGAHDEAAGLVDGAADDGLARSFVTGMDSPVTMDSSTALRPSTISPSTGTFSPGRTRRRSPTATLSRLTSSSVPSGVMRRAILGARSSRARMAPPVRSRARQLQHLAERAPERVMTAAASK